MNYEDLLDQIKQDPSEHSCYSPSYKASKDRCHEILRIIMGKDGPQELFHPKLGTIKLPYYSMGAIDSVNLFDIDELIIFSFYIDFASRYKKALDIGANLGLHSIVMAKLGLNVQAYEPDPTHYNHLLSNLNLNQINLSVTPIQAAISTYNGETEFVRVLGNTTGSHLSGAKSNAYGDLEKFNVNVLNIQDEIFDADFIKLDAEGEEMKILLAIDRDKWDALDVIAEVGSPDNSEKIIDFMTSINVNIFSQKTGWKQVVEPDGMPLNYKEGSVFLSRKPSMPWLT